VRLGAVVAAVVAEEDATSGADDVAASDVSDVSETVAVLEVPEVAGPEAAGWAALDEQPVAAAATSAPPARSAMRCRGFTAG
jgi:hypothetical protein